MKRNSILHIVGILIAAPLLATGAVPRVEAARLCFCSKADVAKNIAIQRCGRLITYNAEPRGKYVIDEEGRGESTLDADKYRECEEPEPPKCPAQSSGEKSPVVSCPAVSGGGQEAFGIAGSNTIGERLMPRLIEDYAKQLRLAANAPTCGGPISLFDRRSPNQAALKIDCQAKGTETGIAALVDESADVAMLSRPITQEEVAQMRERGFPGMSTALHEHVLALDALSIIVSNESVLRGSLSIDAIADIFSQSDRVNNWSKFGGGAGAIKLYP